MTQRSERPTIITTTVARLQSLLDATFLAGWDRGYQEGRDAEQRDANAKSRRDSTARAITEGTAIEFARECEQRKKSGEFDTVPTEAPRV